MKHNENQNIKICYFIYCINGQNARLLAFANTQRSSTHLRKKYDETLQRLYLNSNSNVEKYFQNIQTQVYWVFDADARCNVGTQNKSPIADLLSDGYLQIWSEDKAVNMCSPIF